MPFVPKGTVPLPLYFLFENQASWIGFLTAVVAQTSECLDTASLAIYLYAVPLCSFIHILGYLDIILQVIEKMKYEMLMKVKTTDEDGLKSTLELETLEIINESSEAPQEEVSFDEWIKILNDMICDVNSIFNPLENLYSIVLFLLEAASLGALFICGMCLTVLKEQQFFAIGVNVICVLLFISCFLNELMLEKLININEALYDLPWWELNPKQRKQLMLLMHCDKIQRGFTAAGIHNLTIERFGIIVKAGYTNLLVLKDLVQK
ncbi:uncharacterized protein LOC134828949 [Culicoides brevitarsis]|uniref:uncharacterized protein LOC134828949 n=1 Tax=Culicoides brevitarsis TaxID=469753 RepID=UPI00307CBDC6